MKNLLFTGILLFTGLSSFCQKTGTSVAATYTSFIDYQKSWQRPAEALQRKEDTLRKQFEAKKLVWPAKFIYVRSFKYDSQLEVWVKDKITDPFQLFKTYRVCALAGTLGPKRMEGDFQVPEGFYYINEFNPKSTYYLSLGINYPNASDRVLSDSLAPGSDIYIHGSCVTVGCIPITDYQIDELYILAAQAKSNGQDFIPVHIYPIRYNVKKSVDYLAGLTKDDAALRKFEGRLEEAFNYFEKYHQLPVVMVDEKGEYQIDGSFKYAIADKEEMKDEKKEKEKTKPAMHRVRNIPVSVEAVREWPQFPGGGEAYLAWLSKLGQDMVAYLPGSEKKAHVQVEFVVDTDGVPVNFNVVKGVNPEFDDELVTHLEKMPAWKPATMDNKPVAKKMKQTIEIAVQ